MQANGLASLPRVSIQAFCETQGVSQFITEVSRDRRMMRAHTKVMTGGVDSAVETYKQAPTPNIIIIESNSAREHLIGQLDQLAEFCDVGTKVVIIGKSNDIVLYRELRSRGVSEYFVQPLDPVDFVSALAHLYVDGSIKKIGRVFGFFGSRGGVGASTCAQNFAWALAQEVSSQVSIFDFDFAFGTAALNFNQDPNATLGDLLRSLDRVDNSSLDRVLTSGGDRLNIAAAPVMLDRSYDFAETDLDQLLDAARELVPNVVLDMPHMWTGAIRRSLISCDEIILVATPDLASLRNARGIYDVMRTTRPNDNMPKLILNMTNVPKRQEISIDDFSKALEVKPLAVIPFDSKTFSTAANNGQMIAEVDSSQQIFRTLVRQLIGKSDGETSSKPSLFAPLLKRIGQRS